MPRPYPWEFRKDVIRVARNREPGVRLKDVAKDFGISESCPINWLASDFGQRVTVIEGIPKMARSTYWKICLVMGASYGGLRPDQRELLQGGRGHQGQREDRRGRQGQGQQHRAQRQGRPRPGCGAGQRQAGWLQRQAPHAGDQEGPARLPGPALDHHVELQQCRAVGRPACVPDRRGVGSPMAGDSAPYASLDGATVPTRRQRDAGAYARVLEAIKDQTKPGALIQVDRR